MTVKDLINLIDDFNFNFTNQFDAYNALCDSSKRISDIVNINLEKGLDWDEIFLDKIGYDYMKDTIINLQKEYDDIDLDIFYSKLIVDSIYDDNGIMLAVHYED